MKPTFLNHPRRESHKLGNFLRNFILGGQDGLVNVLGIVLGISAAGGDTKILFAAALAATFSEALSMGAVAYTSTLTERDHYLRELQIEENEIRDLPDIEKEEIRMIYKAKGFTGDLLENIVSTISSNKDNWIKFMMGEELHLQPVETKEVLRASIIVTIAAIVGSLIPLTPFLILERSVAVLASVTVSALALFAIGAYEALSFVGDWRKSGIRMVVIGLGAALVGFMIGRIFNTI
ncbi:MAG: VIT1/CCC1 transporter family protein [Methanotrichaceae archaeon]